MWFVVGRVTVPMTARSGLRPDVAARHFRPLAHLPGVTDARELLQRLVGRQLRTISQGKPNTVLRVDAETVLVGTGVSPDGRSIPIEWLQDALDVLDRDGELRFDRSLYWYRRAAFIGAVLITLPDVEVIQTRPRLVRRRQTTTKAETAQKRDR